VTHWLAYACWPFAFVHALGTGSDAGTWWRRTVADACLTALVAAVAWRFSARRTVLSGAQR
jgi:methionine sulfoxide reductase heme-binding subunit